MTMNAEELGKALLHAGQFPNARPVLVKVDETSCGRDIASVRLDLLTGCVVLTLVPLAPEEKEAGR